MAKMTEEDKQKYSADNLPKIENPLLYFHRALWKNLITIYIGLGAMFLAVIVFPLIRLFTFILRKDFGTAARVYVAHTFRMVLRFTDFLGCTKVYVEQEEYLRHDMHGKIIVANHPSLLDFVQLMAHIPNALFIVGASYAKTPLGGVIKQAYITNNTDFNELAERCKAELDRGNNVFIFPEGTRSLRHGRNSFKKGAARIAVKTGYNIQPLFIGGTDKYGLGKHDPKFAYNPVEKWVWDFKVLPEINSSDYKDLSETIATKRLTEKMQEVLVTAYEDYKKNNTQYRTINNF